jgi:Transcriptional Coactivator p15 (PC4)
MAVESTRSAGQRADASNSSRGIASKHTLGPSAEQRTGVGDDFIAIIPKNKREDIRISLSKFNDIDLINIRIFVDYSGGERGPSKKGISVRVAQLPALLEALHQAEAQARASGLIGGES